MCPKILAFSRWLQICFLCIFDAVLKNFLSIENTMVVSIRITIRLNCIESIAFLLKWFISLTAAKDRHQASIQASKAFNKQAASASAVMAAAEAKAAALKAKNCNRSKLARAKSASACFEMCTDCGKMQFMGAEIKPLTRTASKNKTPRH